MSSFFRSYGGNLPLPTQSHLLPAPPPTAGELHTQGIITAGGLIFCCIGNFFMFLSGANYALTMVRLNCCCSCSSAF
jgi:hypothetical protein